MARIYAKPLNEKAREHFYDVDKDYFRHTYNPDWCYSFYDYLWVTSGYSYKFSLDFQRKKLEIATKGLVEGVDYEYIIIEED